MSGNRIMIVEDETIIAMDISRRLKSFGYEVVATAVSCAQALERVAVANPDLIIMDIMIKGPIDGIETATLVREKHRVPVIFLSANSEESTVIRARAAAPYGYLIKPFRPEELRASIEVALVKASMEEQLYRSEQWFAKTLHCISDAVVATDDHGTVRFVNTVAERLTGWREELAQGRPIEEVIRTEGERERQPVINPVINALANHCEQRAQNAVVLVSADGTKVTIEESASPIVDDDRNLLGAVMVFRDVTERRRVDRALQESEKRFHNAFEHASVGMALVGMDGCILQSNAAIARMFGYCESEMVGMNLRTLSHPDDLQGELQALDSLLANEVPAVQMEKRYMHRRGHALWTMMSMSMVRSLDEVPLYCIVQTQDLTARRTAEERLVQLAQYDLLTGLVNRAYFIETAGLVISRMRRRAEHFGLIFLDLDGFKTVNDTLGHDVGDKVLSTVAMRLRECVRDGDVVCRWGGDEFVMIAELAGDSDQLACVASKLLEDVRQPIHVAGDLVSVSASIGIAVYPRDGQTVTALVANADSAMYQAKDLGKNQYCFVAKDSAVAIMRDSRRENQLRHAVERGELTLYFQPMIRCDRIVSVEALLRWQHPQEGLLGPDEFIPIAERTGLILPIGQWVLRTACAQVFEWRRQSPSAAHLKVAVNVSVRQLRLPNFARLVADSLAAVGLDADALELEVTETWLMSSVQRSAQVLTELSNMGIQISVDDFGTGYSSLAYLKRLPLNRLKIDRSFLVGLPGDLQGEAIVRAIVSLANELNYEAVAEGVETSAQRDFVLSLGDLVLQGYGLYRPMDAQSFGRLLGEISHMGEREAGASLRGDRLSVLPKIH